MQLLRIISTALATSLVLLATVTAAFADEDEGVVVGACQNAEAREEFQKGFELQQSRKAQAAVSHFEACLKAEAHCISCEYELGWTYWTLDRYADTVRLWKAVRKTMPDHAGVADHLAAAEAKLKGGAKAGEDHAPIKHPAIGTRSGPGKSSVHLTLVARLQSYDREPHSKHDHFDADIDSPKSARFSADGTKVYVNSLEAEKTLAYDAKTFARVGAITHAFTAKDADLFHEKTAFKYKYDARFAGARRNIFRGKPVESELTHEGRYLWIPYYRRSFDPYGTNPSAVAIIDTQSDEIVRVMATGPIAKYATASPDGKFMAISHWGDNTLSLIDIHADRPQDFKYTAHLVVEHALDLKEIGAVNRDKACGFCVRGLAWSPDSRYLFVARMGGAGGIAVFDVQGHAKARYLGTLTGMKPKPRDILISHDGNWLYLSSTMSGYVSRIALTKILRAIAAPSPRGSKRVFALKGFEPVFVGIGPRSVRLSPDDRFLFAAVNAKQEIVAVDTRQMKVAARIAADPYPVGMAISADGKQLWITAQSRAGRGGNAVSAYRIDYFVAKRKLASAKSAHHPRGVTAKKPGGNSPHPKKRSISKSRNLAARPGLQDPAAPDSPSAAPAVEAPGLTAPEPFSGPPPGEGSPAN